MQIFSQNKTNLHTHSDYCNHAVGTIADYVGIAKANGNLSILGFSEHMPMPGDTCKDDMLTSKLPMYVRDVRQEAIKSDTLKIFLGGECEYFPSLLNYYKEELLGAFGFDYLLCSIHLYHNRSENQLCYVSQSKDFLPYLSEYVKNYTTALASGIFLFGCHPDLFLSSIRDWDEDLKAASLDIIQCAKDLDIPLEVNGAGLRKPLIATSKGLRHPYSTEEFFSLASQQGAKICCNSDAHDPKLVHGLITNGFHNECYAFADKLGLDFVDWQIDDMGKLSSIQPKC